MIKKKVCMVGAFAVGKTSLTQKFVNNIFSDAYLTTVGVKIDSIDINDSRLIIWDIAGKDSLSPINVNYLVGASGAVVVLDCTRKETILDLNNMMQTIQQKVGDIPIVVALNKVDLVEEESVKQISEQCMIKGVSVIPTSAKEGKNVSDLFACLLEKMCL